MNYTFIDTLYYVAQEPKRISKIKERTVARLRWAVARSTLHREASRPRELDYDPSGNRIAKHVYDASDVWKYSLFYVRDAQGNVMSVYKQEDNSGAQCTQIEKHIYGSSRMGMDGTPVDAMTITDPLPEILTHYWGKRNYELTNHLGNVLCVVSDKIIPYSDHNEADILHTYDYYPFGSPMPGRNFEKEFCSVVTNTVVTTPINDDFNSSGVAGWGAINANSTVTNPTPSYLLVGLTGGPAAIGTYKYFTAVNGDDYVLSFDLLLNNSGTLTVEIEDISTSIIYATTTFSTAATYTLSFTAGSSGTYQVRFYSGTLSPGKKTFRLDNIVLTQSEEEEETVCNGLDYRYGMNGKEKDDETYGNGNEYDFGARIYDPRLGRWLSVDPMAKTYSNLSPYNFAGNTPIQAMDPDGRLIIFINGFYGKPTGAGHGGEKAHWGNNWVENVKSNLEDHKAYYFDGSIGGNTNFPVNNSVEYRKAMGYVEGRASARSILENLDAGETVKFITSSMGAAYERGFSQALVDEADAMNKEIDSYNEMATAFNTKIDKMIEENPETSKGLADMKMSLKKKVELKIELVVDLDAHQGGQLAPDPNAQQNYYGLNYGMDIEKKTINKEGLAENAILGEAIPGSKELGKGTMAGHHPSWFPTKHFLGLTSKKTGTPASSDKAKDHENPR